MNIKTPKDAYRLEEGHFKLKEWWFQSLNMGDKLYNCNLWKWNHPLGWIHNISNHLKGWTLFNTIILHIWKITRLTQSFGLSISLGNRFHYLQNLHNQNLMKFDDVSKMMKHSKFMGGQFWNVFFLYQMSIILSLDWKGS
jgi:hypothetical protein